MTEKLTSLLRDKAAAADFAPVDLAAITRDGARVVRRRRWAAAAAGASAAVVVGSVGVVVLGGGSPDELRTDVATTTTALPTDVLTWATGSVLHTPQAEADLGHPIAAYVRTTEGYVFTDGRGAVFSFADGEVTPVGTTSDERPRLVGDADGTLAGWVDPSGDRPAFVVLDLADGEVRRFDDHTAAGMGLLADEKDPAYLYALDESTAYWHDTRGAVAVDVTTGEATVVDAEARNGFDLLAAEDGALATIGEGDAVSITEPGAAPLALDQVFSSLGVFSPGATYLTVDADEPRVFTAATGTEVEVRADAWFATGYEWLDDQTVAMIAEATKKAPFELLTCDVTTGECSVAVPDLGGPDDVTFTLPSGEGTDD